MGRTKGALNKTKLPTIYELDLDERLEIVAKLLIDLITEELCTKD
jgi:hypothetical protein